MENKGYRRRRATEERVAPAVDRNHKESRNWSELPTELLELILKKQTSVADIFRFKSVCPLWNYAARSYANSPNRITLQNCLVLQSPLHKSFRFFDPAEKKVYEIGNVVFDTRAKYLGSSYGWLIVVDEKEIAYLVNPFSRASSIQLPNTRTFGIISYRSKTLVSSNPSRNKNFLVVVRNNERIWFCKNGDRAWSGLNDVIGDAYDDILFQDHQLYALAEKGKSLEVWDCRDCSPKKTMCIQDTVAAYESIWDRNYLVESSGEILRLRGRYPCLILVEKLNLTVRKWEKVESLGDRVLFLFKRELSSLSNRIFDGCEENSIYIRDGWTDTEGAEGDLMLRLNVKGRRVGDSVSLKHLFGCNGYAYIYIEGDSWIVPNP